MSGGKVVAWVCFQPPGSADPEIYFQPDCPYPEPTADTGIWQPLVLQSDLAAAIARAESAEALLREVSEWISGWSPSFADDPEWQPVADRIDAIAAQQAEGEAA